MFSRIMITFTYTKPLQRGVSGNIPPGNILPGTRILIYLPHSKFSPSLDSLPFPQHLSVNQRLLMSCDFL